MLNYKNSLRFSQESFDNILEYENISTEDFKKYISIILKIHIQEFGYNKFYTDYINEFTGKEDALKKEILTKMSEFMKFLYEKSLV